MVAENTAKEEENSHKYGMLIFDMLTLAVFKTPKYKSCIPALLFIFPSNMQ